MSNSQSDAAIASNPDQKKSASVSAPKSSRRVAVVTGAAQGIGKAIALKLAEDGYDVVLSDLGTKVDALQKIVQEFDHGNESGGGRGSLESEVCDVTKEEDVKKLVDGAVKKFGRLDCMVANAGITSLVPLAEVSLEHFNQMYAVNTASILLCFRYAATAMITGGTAQGGRLIAACSQAGKKGERLVGAYAASKFAVRGLTQTAGENSGCQVSSSRESLLLR